MPLRSFRNSLWPLSAHPLGLRGLQQTIRIVFAALFMAGPSLFDTGVLATQRAQAQEKASCDFEAGFAELRELLGAATVGDCLERERYDQSNGDSFQTTTR